jgi:hypothetical protein
VVETAEAAPQRTVRSGDELPKSVARAVQAWAGARGLVVSQDFESPHALSVLGRSSLGPDAREVILGRDGWRARLRGEPNASLRLTEFPEGTSLLPLDTWLADDGGGRAWVTWRRGIVCLSFTEMEQVQGDPVAFAISWAKLFDESVMQPIGCISLEERMAAGQPAERAPIAQAAATSGTSRASALLAWAALGLAFLALAVRPSSGRRNASIQRHEAAA